MSARQFIAPTKRTKMTRARRVKVFLACNGTCHLCGVQIRDGEKWELSHPVPLALGGADDETNMAPAHKRCHDQQTKQDRADIATRNRRVDAGYAGKPKSKRGFRKPPGTYFDWRTGRYIRPPTGTDAEALQQVEGER